MRSASALYPPAERRSSPRSGAPCPIGMTMPTRSGLAGFRLSKKPPAERGRRGGIGDARGAPAVGIVRWKALRSAPASAKAATEEERPAGAERRRRRSPLVMRDAREPSSASHCSSTAESKAAMPWSPARRLATMSALAASTAAAAASCA
eukprot:scaffold1640_cov111-Isochrysis_galbana.AAC.17